MIPWDAYMPGMPEFHWISLEQNVLRFGYVVNIQELNVRERAKLQAKKTCPNIYILEISVLPMLMTFMSLLDA